MTPTLSPETLRQIVREAEAYEDTTRQKVPKEHHTVPSFISYVAGAFIGYQDGATAYAHYKEQFDQAKKALEEIEELTKRHWSENSNIDIYLKCRDALSSWKEEGKEDFGDWLERCCK